MNGKAKKLTSITFVFLMLLGVLTAAPFTAGAAGDSFENATWINVNQTYTDNISTYDEEDYYKFNLSNTSKVSINFKHSTIDSEASYWWMGLYDLNGNCVIDMYSQGNKTNLTSGNVGLPKGTYYLKITKYYHSDKDYSFTVNSTSNSNWETETNNDYDTADAINTNTQYYGALQYYSDNDYYKFNLSNTSKVSINFKHSTIDSEASYWWMGLYDLNGNCVIDMYSQGNKTNLTSGNVGLPKGTYYLKITKYYHSDKDYSFTVNSTSNSNWETETNDDYDTADAINTNTQYYGALQYYSDNDYYKFNLSNTSKVSINFKHSTIDSEASYWWMGLYDLNGNCVIDMYSQGNNTNLTSQSVNLQRGTYYLKITKCYHSDKDYSFTINEGNLPTSITLNKTSLTMGVNENVTLTATVSPSNATNKSVTWSSSNTGIATVSGGKITAKATGTATITAKTVNGKTATCKVTVKKAPTSISLNKTKITLGVGETFDFNSALPSGCGAYSIKYTTSNSSVCTVKAAGGLATAKKVGTATITATTYNGKKASCTVTVKKAPTSISLNKTKITLGVGETFDFNSALPSGCGAYSIKYTTSNSSVCTVKAAGGLATAKKVGTATITATTYNGKKASCTVTVKKAPTSISLNKTTLTLKVGQQFDFNSSLPSGCASYSIKYTSSNTSVCTVKSSGGMATAKKKGTCTITATTYNGKKASCKVTVK